MSCLDIDIDDIDNSTIFTVRVVAKSGLRHHCENIDGDIEVTNTYFTMIWLTNYGEMHTIAFKQDCYEMINEFEEGCLYEVRKVKAVPIQNQYWHPEVQFKLLITRFTKVEELFEDPWLLPMPEPFFTRIRDLQHIDDGEIVDVIAVVLRKTKVRFVNTFKGGMIPMTQAVLVDQSGFCVQVAFWGIFAWKFFHTDDTVLMFKAARVRSFNGGTCLTYVADCVLKFNPDIPAAYKVRNWVKNNFNGKAYNISLDRYDFFE